MIRVLVAEDSLTMRELLVEILRSDPDIEVIGVATNGAEAIEMTARLRPDIVTMDIQMPVLDGLDATREIMAHTPVPIVIVSASTSTSDVQRSFDAMQAGALMLLDKPVNPTSATFEARRDRLVSMIKAMADVKVVRRRLAPPAPQPVRLPGPVATVRARLVAIAASTGGPAALQRVLSALPADLEAPVVVVQHIAAGFVPGLAQWLSASCPLAVKVAEHDEELLRGTAYLAPDDEHLGLSRAGRVRLSGEPPADGHRPSANHLFDEAAAAFGAGVVCVVLTGMGRDGVRGALRVRESGGWVIAQDEESSVVYGMNGETVRAGAASEILPLARIGAAVTRLVRGSAGADD